ncbi:hypothetical protein NPIL_563711 [Nephila pilipes]|uniref:Uncharacterized protein n=1 Tax=Nephila pilipes TaxID=299642 RepID=A0A8X6QBJ8_NEPPI|nr:hypothetical protein NPIL_563711 [Nephila pilipes]
MKRRRPRPPAPDTTCSVESWFLQAIGRHGDSEIDIWLATGWLLKMRSKGRVLFTPTYFCINSDIFKDYSDFTRISSQILSDGAMIVYEILYIHAE